MRIEEAQSKVISALFQSANFQLKPTCEHPVFIHKLGLYVACNHCLLCKERIKKEWITRCECQLRTSRTGSFITLTFDDAHTDVSYKQVQDFLKRYRRRFKCKIKYFGCFEKGELNNRPHYHLIVFGHNVKASFRSHFACNDYVQSIWKNGFVKVEYLNSQSIKYVCQYVAKKTDIVVKGLSRLLQHCNKFAKTDVHYQLMSAQLGQVQEEKETYLFMSKGLGFDFLFANIKNILARGKVKLLDKLYNIPKAFKDKLRKLDNIHINLSLDNIKYDYLDRYKDLWFNSSVDPYDICYLQKGYDQWLSERNAILLAPILSKVRYNSDKKRRNERLMQVPF